MSSTSIRSLVVLAALGAVLGWMIVSWWESAVGPLRVPLSHAVMFLGLAMALLWAGWPVKQWNSDKRENPLDPLRAARVVALARTCSRAGALFCGWLVGHCVWLLPDITLDARLWACLRTAAVALAALVLAIVGVLVERWCTLPPDDGVSGGGEAAAA